MQYVEVILNLKVNNCQENNNKQAFVLFNYYLLLIIDRKNKINYYNQLKEDCLYMNVPYIFENK